MPVLIHSQPELDALRRKVLSAADRTLENLATHLREGDALAKLARLKFDHTGFHPTEPRGLNLVEQINQTFTYLASFDATSWLLSRHPEAAPYVLNLGTRSGFDIESQDESIAAETFATVDPKNNKKLLKDIAKVAKSQAKHKYVFYICPAHAPCEPHVPLPEFDVKVVSLGWGA